MDPANNWIAQHHLLRTDYAMIGFTSAVFGARVVVQFWRRKTFEVQDGLLYVAFAAYLTFSILYVVITPIFFKLQALQKGDLAPWPSMPMDLKFTSEVMWSSGMLYWTCLWFVKFSLLALYKRLLLGMPNAYRRTWWGILMFCLLTWATCIITGPGLACDNTKKFFDEGVLCSSPAEVRRQTANLYYAYAVDALTNLMVMFLPIKLIWTTSMERPKKIGCFLLFASGFVCILFSTLRIVQVGGDGKPRSPDPKWLTMWTIIECSTAVIIGCGPVLAVLIPKSKAPADRVSHDATGYVRQSANRSNASPSKSHRLRAMLGSTNRSVGISTTRSTGGEDPQAGQEKLPERRNDGKGILITKELREEHARRMAAQADLNSAV